MVAADAAKVKLASAKEICFFPGWLDGRAGAIYGIWRFIE
jgi:hypothetical protein